jgi:FkbM family methyltransferase
MGASNSKPASESPKPAQKVPRTISREVRSQEMLRAFPHRVSPQLDLLVCNSSRLRTTQAPSLPSIPCRKPMLEKIASHARRIKHQLGKNELIGDTQFRFHGYHASQLEHSEKRHEIFLLEVLRRQLKSRPGAFLDVGVNIGQTLFKMLAIDRARIYIGFEPQIACCYEVERFLRLNRISNAVVLPLALSNSNTISTFYTLGQYDETASLVAPPGAAPEIRTASHVQTRIGDEVLRELEVSEVCAIKIDVEGAELSVLEGLQETLRTKRPSIIFEVLPNFSGLQDRIRHPTDACMKNRAAADALFRLLSQLGYDIFHINEGNSRETKIDRFELDDQDKFPGINFIAHARI